MSPAIRDEVLNGNNNALLVAAARGAALTVGKWAIETQHMSVDANKADPAGVAPITALMQFHVDAPQSPRTATFLAMLAAHGADIDAFDSTHKTSLQNALEMNDKRAAQMLLGVGANVDLLSPDEKLALKKLLAQPDDSPYEAEREPDCVKA